MKISSQRRNYVSFAAVLFLVLAFVAGIGFSGVRAEAASEEKTIRIAHISDMHVMITDYCNVYSKSYVAETKVTKLLEETPMIAEAVFEDLYNMNENAPMYVFITGDITSNGEYENHVWLSKLYKAFTKKMRERTDYDFSGFQIFLSPGNHDLYNCKAKSYMPTVDELSACANDEEREALLSSYDKRSVPSITSKQFMDLYKDFGYCDCPDRKNGHHLGSCGMVEGCSIEYFFESEYWYDDATSRDGQGLEVRNPSEATLKAFDASNKDYDILNADARFGACSYIARMKDFDVITFDANTRGYKYDKWSTMATSDPAVFSCGGWHESTGGMISEDQLRWAVSSVREDVSNNKVVFALGHTNFLPHFDTEDEVISLFTYDNWEEASYTLADAGVRYLFSGHQHASDITSYVTQKGNVVYDVEAGSLSSYGCSWRTMDLKIKKDASGVYTEDFESLTHNLNTPHFTYGIYKTSAATPLSESPVALFAGEEETLMPLHDASGYLTLERKVTADLINHEEIGIADYLAAQMYNMASSLEYGMPGEYVGEKIYDLLDGLTEKLTGLSYTKGLVSDIVDDLSGIDLCKFSFSGNNYTVSDAPVKGYDLADFTKGIALYLMQYDFSGSENKKLTLAKAFLVIYGGHLSGAHTSVMDEEIAPLIDMLKDGRFVRFVVNFIEDALLPQLETLLDVPIRFDESTAALTGPSIDITAALKNTSSGDTAVKSLIDGYVKKFIDERVLFAHTKNGYSSLRLLLADLYDVINDVLYTDEDEISNSTVKMAASLAREMAMELSFSKYYDKAISYLRRVIAGENLRVMIDNDLVNKYVTDAFCVNLGSYGARILLDMNVDETEDGSRWISGDRYTRFPVQNFKHILQVKNGFDGHTFMIKADGTKTLPVTPTAENGLLPNLITVSYNEDIYTEKKISWFTALQVDVFDKVGSKYAYSLPDSYIRYSINEDMSDAVTVKAKGENVDRVLPTIDLGIAFFNLNNAHKNYNRYTVTLDGLKKGTTYYYQLGKDGAWTKTFRFATASDGEFTFMAITDIQGSIEENYTASNVFLTKALQFFGSDPAFIMSGGDNVDNGKNIMQYTWLLNDQQEVWANNTFISAAGNHEKNANALDSIIALPDNAVVTGETGYYYSFDYNAAHFIVLNTNDLDEDNTLDGKQTSWLTRDLMNNQENTATKWTIVLLHKGPYTAGSHAFDEDVIALRHQLAELFDSYGVDLVLQGHDHTYSVSEFIGEDGKKTVSYTGGKIYNPEGVLYINLGTMGDKFYDYIYSDEVDLADRTAAPEGLSKYFTSANNLELTETPVFAKITVTENDLIIKTYTISDGEIVSVDDITLTHASIEPKSGSNIRTYLLIGGIVLFGLVIALIVILKKKGV